MHRYMNRAEVYIVQAEAPGGKTEGSQKYFASMVSQEPLHQYEAEEDLLSNSKWAEYLKELSSAYYKRRNSRDERSDRHTDNSFSRKRRRIGFL